jgi:D-alanyl-D-alanine carboxypeptidase (penicillin-binding protein 5/6)
MRKKLLRFFLLFTALAFICACTHARAVEAGEITLKSETAVLMEAQTGQVLFEKDMSRRMYPASITKIMTALLALEKGKLDDIVTMSREAVFSIGRDTSHIALDTDEKLTLEEALYAMALASANDAANGIAELVGGTMDGFAAMMNGRAKQAGALDTNFANAHGLFDEDHYTTAYDMARITMAAVKIPEFTKIFSTLLYEMPPTNKQREARTLRCTNAMMIGKYKYDGLIAGKTGWINQSGNTLVTVAGRDGRTLIAVVMQAALKSDACEDTTALLDYGFSLPAQVSAPETHAQTIPADAHSGKQREKAPGAPWVFGILGILLGLPLAPLLRRYIAMKRHCRRKLVPYALLPMKKGWRLWYWRIF